MWSGCVMAEGLSNAHHAHRLLTQSAQNLTALESNYDIGIFPQLGARRGEPIHASSPHRRRVPVTDGPLVVDQTNALHFVREKTTVDP